MGTLIPSGERMNAKLTIGPYCNLFLNIKCTGTFLLLLELIGEQF